MRKRNGSQILKRFQGRYGGEDRSKQVVESVYCDIKTHREVTRLQGPPDRQIWRTVPTGFYTPLLDD